MKKSQGANKGFTVHELRVVFGKLRLEITTFLGNWESKNCESKNG